jgi:hypothetical protein
VSTVSGPGVAPAVTGHFALYFEPYIGIWFSESRLQSLGEIELKAATEKLSS